MSSDSRLQPPRVYLVGAGPGDPRLITLRGVECLARADLVLYDYLVNPRLLEHARPGAKLVCLGRHGRDRIVEQDEINRRLVEAAQSGRVVVRLKGGDPAVFARAADEVRALIAAGIKFEIVPGITAALAAGSHAGISLTDRRLASAVALVTGHEHPDKPQAAVDYAALARFPGTLVFYMGVTTAADWTQALVAAGKTPETPVALVRRCSWPDQETIHSTLAGAAAEIARRKLRPPVIAIVGDVVSWDADRAWFAARPLTGQTVLVTRPSGQSDALRDALEELGAQVLVQPAISIEPPADWSPVDAAIDRLERFDWLVFSSANGVRMFFDRLCRLYDARRLGNIRLAAIGPGTAEELAAFRLKADLVPAEYRAEALADALAAAPEQRFLLVRASRGREVLAERLRAAGKHVEQVVAYLSVDVHEPDVRVSEALAARKVDWVTVTSSAIARSLAAMFGDRLRQVRLASISPVTSATLKELGHSVAAEADPYTSCGLVEAILRAQPPG